MLNDLKNNLQGLLALALKSQFSSEADVPAIELQVPADKKHGDFSCNVAMKSSKVLRKSPVAIADDFISCIKDAISKSDIAHLIHNVEVKAPGFINFYVSSDALYLILKEIFEKDADYGKSDYGKGKKIQIEFVSANPTGPLSVAHARQAVVGDVLGNILKAIGFDVAKEYYVNDGGNQINILGKSIELRALEHLGETVEFPEECYQGEYIKDMAELFLKDNNVGSVEQVNQDALWADKVREFGVKYLLDVIRAELSDFGVNFDIWSYESKVATKDLTSVIIEHLRKKDFVYEKDGALWFKSTAFGDDKDRVVKKSDGNFTYLAPDIVYHKNKFDRGFDGLINIWGPDHHGYIPRIKAAVQALGKDESALDVLIVQLATIYRNGEVVSMSTRKGQYISLREVMDEVGVDAARFFFLMRHIKMHLEFDLEFAKKQSAENPVYYIQYAHARVFSINEKAYNLGIKVNSSDFSLLKENEEFELIKKLGGFNDTLVFCYEQLDPYPLVSYLQELATLFHKFYDCHRVVDHENVELSSQRLALINAARIVLGDGLDLLGVSAPLKM